MPEKYISRRDFLKTAVLLFGGVALSKIAEPIADGLLESSFENLMIVPAFPLPQQLNGLLINSPFLWRYPQIQKSVISQSLEAGVYNLRLFANDDIEPRLGSYEIKAVEAISRLNKNIAYQSDNLHTIISLYDAYGMKIRNNLIYGQNTITSPYSDGSETSYRNFFTDKKTRQFFLNRIKMLVESLGDSPVISAWEVGNEFAPPQGMDGQRIFQDWFLEVVDTIHKIDKVRPILTGVEKPWDLDEKKLDNKNVINTVHIYLPSAITNFCAFLQNKNRKLPLLVEETGFPGRLMGFDFPTLFADIGYNNFIHKIIRAATFSNNLLAIDSLGLWKIDGYNDGFPNPLELPLTRETIAKFVSCVNRKT